MGNKRSNTTIGKVLVYVLTLLIILGLTIGVRAEAFSVRAKPSEELSGLAGTNFAPRYSDWAPTFWAEYDGEMMREDLEIVRDLGFNAVRVFLSLRAWNDNPRHFENSFGDFLESCRNLDLKVLPVIFNETQYIAPFFSGQQLPQCSEALRKESFTPYRYMHSLVQAFDAEFADVIAAWDIHNEPDWQCDAYKLDWGDMRKKVKWMAETLAGFQLSNPTTIGWAYARTLRDYPELSEDISVLSYHSYSPRISGFEKDFLIAELAAQKQGNKPLLITECGNPGYMQPYSDPIGFAEEKNLSYFIWGSFAMGWWKYNQGVVHPDGGLRVSTLPQRFIDQYPERSTRFTTGYDLTRAGTNQLQNVALAAYNAVSGSDVSLSILNDAFERFHNAMRITVPYWTPDVWDVYKRFDKETSRACIIKAFRETYDALRPHIRDYGNLSNDNSLGGHLRIGYEEWPKEKFGNSAGQDNVWPWVYEAGKGVGSSTAIVSGSSGRLGLSGIELNQENWYRFEADINVTGNEKSRGGFVLYSDPTSGVFELSQDGVYIFVAGRADNTGSGRISVLTISPYKLGVNVVLDPDDYDEQGYVHLAIEFAGAGTKDSPLVCKVLVNEEQRGIAEFDRGVNIGQDAHALALHASMPFVPWSGVYFDNLKVSNLTTEEMLLSDSFDNAGKSGEAINYRVDQGLIFTLDLLEEALYADTQ